SGSQGQPFTLPSAPSTAANPLWAGRSRSLIWGVGSSHFSGSLGQVAVYGTALSSSRVQAHLSAGPSYPSAVLADAPVAYYRLDELSQLQAGGFGLWPVTKTDANGQTTGITYDALGRETSETLPGEGAGLTTLGTGYAVWCSGTAAQSPCLEVDKTQRLNGST